MIYTVTFDRIGRNHQPPPLTTADVETETEMLSAIHSHARPMLVSRFVEPLLHEGADERGGTGFLSCGFQSGGTFTYTEAQP